MEDIEYGRPGTSGGRLLTEYIFSSTWVKNRKKMSKLQVP